MVGFLSLWSVNGFPEIDYENVDQRIPLPKGVASGRDWGTTVVTMAKFQDGRTTFEDLARTALGGNTDHIKYLSWIKERFKKQISDEPASQGPDLAAYPILCQVQASCGASSWISPVFDD